MTPLPRRTKVVVIVAALALCVLVASLIEVRAAPPAVRSLAPWPPRSGYLIALAVVVGPLLGSSALRRWRLRAIAREDHRDALEQLGTPQFDARELNEGACMTLYGRLIRHDARDDDPFGGEPQLMLRASQASSWSTHLPRQLALQLLDVRLSLRGVVTLLAGSHERWLAFSPESREGHAAPAHALVVIERSVRTGDRLIVRGQLKRAGDGAGWIMTGDHRTPIELASVRAPSLSLPQRAPARSRWRLLAALVASYLLCLYLAARYHQSGVDCAAPACAQPAACSWTVAVDAAVFHCELREQTSSP